MTELLNPTESTRSPTESTRSPPPPHTHAHIQAHAQGMIAALIQLLVLLLMSCAIPLRASTKCARATTNDSLRALPKRPSLAVTVLQLMAARCSWVLSSGAGVRGRCEGQRARGVCRDTGLSGPKRAWHLYRLYYTVIIIINTTNQLQRSFAANGANAS